MGPNQLKSFCTAKETINKTKRKPTEWEKNLANKVTKKGLIYKITNSGCSSKSRKTNNSVKNGQKTEIDFSPEKTYRWPKNM